MACNISKENLASMFIQDNFSSVFTILKNNQWFKMDVFTWSEVYSVIGNASFYV